MILRAVSVAALFLAVAAEVSAVATGKPQRAAVVCPPSSASRVVGTVTKVVHSKVYVGRRYVAATPFDLRSRSHICTDDTGEAIFGLARSNKSLVCIALRRTDVQVRPSVALAATVHHGTSWCSIRWSDGSLGVPIGEVRLRPPKGARALVGGVRVGGSATIKVEEGSIFVSTRLRKRVKVSRRRQVVVFRNGQVSAGKLKLSTDDRVAIALLRLAR
jgi:hypothetical protein